MRGGNWEPEQGEEVSRHIIISLEHQQSVAMAIGQPPLPHSPIIQSAAKGSLPKKKIADLET